MTPAVLRARARVELPEMAKRLGISVPELRAIERSPLGAWSVVDLSDYLRQLGLVLRLTARERGSAGPGTVLS